MKNEKRDQGTINESLRTVGVIALFFVVALLWFVNRSAARRHAGPGIIKTTVVPASSSASPQVGTGPPHCSRGYSKADAQEIVAARVVDFARKRLVWVRAKSLRAGKDVPPEVEQFFAAMQRGKWEEIDAIFSHLAKRSAQYEGSSHAPELDPFWPAVLEAYGAAEQAHLWPAEKLIDYADSIMDKLRPGMVYVGGTDPGRFVPTLFNETGDGEPHIILTQNALADSRYLEYAQELYGDRVALPTAEVSGAIFQDYVTDAGKRLEHDERSPDGPKQIKPGEKVERVDGKVVVSGQVAVMAINEKLLQWTLQNNPSLSFAVEESFPFRSTYGSAVPLGPVMEVRAEEEFSRETAAAALAYWRDAAKELKQQPPSESAAELKTYSHMAVSQANLLASHNYAAEAEATYRLASDIFPRNTDAMQNFARFLSSQGRAAEGSSLIAEFRRRNPDIDVGVIP